MKHCKRKNSEPTIKHFTSSKELPDVWNEFIPQHHFLQHDNLAVTEQSGLHNISFLYIMCMQNDEVQLAAGFQILKLRPEHVNKKMVSSLQFLGWSSFTNLIRPKLLIGGHLFRHDVRSIYCNGQLAPFDEYQLYKLCIDKAMQISCASAVVLKDMPEKLAKYFQNFAPQYIQLRNDISMEMEIESSWNDIHDYEKALKHKYAQRFRKIRRPWDELEVKEFSVAEVVEKKEQLYQLYHQVAAHQQVRIGLLSADFLPELKKKHDDDLRVWGIYEEKKLIGFFSAWVQPDAFDMFYIGFEYEKNHELSLYFNILFFSIEQAIKFKKPKLILGRTALDAKARLGCTPKYLSTFLFVSNKLIRDRVLRAQSNTSNREGAWESRHPFRGQQN